MFRKINKCEETRETASPGPTGTNGEAGLLVPGWRFPSPLAGEGGLRSKTDEGSPRSAGERQTGSASRPLTRPPFGGHPLPQGERELLVRKAAEEGGDFEILGVFRLWVLVDLERRLSAARGPRLGRRRVVAGPAEQA